MKNFWVGLSVFLFIFSVSDYLWVQSSSKPREDHIHLAPIKQAWLKEPIPLPLPDFQLISHNNQTYQLKDFQGQWDILLFGYTSCPDVCPLTLQILMQSLDELKREGVVSIPRPIFISIDPERDLPLKIAEYLAPIHQNLLGLTGTHTELKKLIQSLRSDYQIDKQKNEISVNHPTTFYFINPSGQLTGMFSNISESKQLKQDIKMAMKEPHDNI